MLFNPNSELLRFKNFDQTFTYHQFHIDSELRFKVLISLENTLLDTRQFSYANFNSPLASFSFYLSFIFSFCYRIIFLVSRRLSPKSNLISSQPPKLINYFQNSKLYRHFPLAHAGDFCVFNNLFPHCSHSGDFVYTSKMLQLVLIGQENDFKLRRTRCALGFIASCPHHT